MEYWETYSKPYENIKRKKAIKKENYTLYYDGFAIKGNLPYALCVYEKKKLLETGRYNLKLFTIK